MYVPPTSSPTRPICSVIPRDCGIDVLTFGARAGLPQYRPRRSGRREGWRGESEDRDGGMSPSYTYIEGRAEADSWGMGLADRGGRS